MRLSDQHYHQLEEMAYQIRRLSVEMISYGMWGHIGGSFSMAELLSVLYFDQMRMTHSAPNGQTVTALCYRKRTVHRHYMRL